MGKVETPEKGKTGSTGLLEGGAEAATMVIPATLSINSDCLRTEKNFNLL